MIALIVLEWSLGGLGLGGWGVQKIPKLSKLLRWMDTGSLANEEPGFTLFLINKEYCISIDLKLHPLTSKVAKVLSFWAFTAVKDYPYTHCLRRGIVSEMVCKYLSLISYHEKYFQSEFQSHTSVILLILVHKIDTFSFAF